MPPAYTTKFKDEHHVFVKNVPAELGIAAVPGLFEQYKPTRIKNVYPTSNITTIVVTFGTYEEAEQAQEDIDGIRLENVVLRVEMYDQRRSVRYIKETQTRNPRTRRAHRPHMGYAEETYDEEYEQEAEELEEAVYVRPAAMPRRASPGITTWANIVGNDRGTGMTPLPAPAKAVQTTDPTLTPDPTPANDNDTQYCDHTHEPAIPYVSDDTASSEHGSIDVLPPSWETASLTDSTTSPTDSELVRLMKETVLKNKPKPVVRTSIFVPWESFDSTERLVQRHCRDCVFCQKRLALKE